MSSTVFHRRFGALVASEDLLRVERVIAFARVLVSAIALLAIWTDPTEPARYASLIYVIAASYAAASIAALVRLRRCHTLPHREAVLAHGIDVTIAAALTLFTDGPNSPFFTFFIYALLSAAYRWGMFETLLTAAASAVLMLVEAMLVNGYNLGLTFGPVEGEFDINRLIMRLFYLWTIGICVGYLGETAHQRRLEAAGIASLGREAWLNAGDGLLKSVLCPVMRLFGSTRAVIVLKGHAGMVAVWRSELAPDSKELATTRSLEDSRASVHLNDSSAEAWHAIVRSDKSIDVVMLDAQGHRIRSAIPTEAVRSFIESVECRSAISVPVQFRNAVIGRAFLLEPGIPLFERESAVRLGQRIASEIAPATHNVFRLRRLRSRAEAGERARIARELHDGSLQSIAAAELRIEVVRRKIARSAPEEADELSYVQDVLTAEIRSLRGLTRRMQAAFSAPNELQTTLSDIISRFERETHIAVRFESDVVAPVSPRTRYEIVRIAQEGLTNIRKHSGARHVSVRVIAATGSVRLVIEDDGHGFAFSGSRSHRELEVMSAGPLIIRERVRALRGELNVVSIPGKGARIEVRLPANPERALFPRSASDHGELADFSD